MKNRIALLTLIPLLASCTITPASSSSKSEKTTQNPDISSSSTQTSSESKQSSEAVSPSVSSSEAISSQATSSEVPTSDAVSSKEVSSEESFFSFESEESSFVSEEEKEDIIPDLPDARLFDHKKSLSVILRMSDDVMSFVSEHQSNRGKYAEAYLPADLAVYYDNNLFVFYNVGIRQKGNTSRTRFFDGNRVYATPHFKVSFKATFDDELYDDPLLLPYKKTWTDSAARKARKNRNLLGYEKLDFKYIPRNQGQCTLQELYCYDAFPDADIYAPQSRVSEFTFGNEESSISQHYQVIETIDKQFLQRRLGKAEAKGDLYKCVYNGMGPANFARSDAVTKDVVDGKNEGVRVPFGKIGVENDYEGYIPTYQLKTNDDLGEEADFSKMTNLINTLWNVTYGSGTKEDLEAVVDVDQFLRFSAVSYLLGNPDDQRYNNNNLYVYFMPSTGKAIFIPYDWDWSLGSDWEYGSSRMADLTPLDRWTLSGDISNNLYLATFLPKEGLNYDASEYVTKYLDYVHSLTSRILNFDKYEHLVDTIGLGQDDLPYVYNYMDQKTVSASYDD